MCGVYSLKKSTNLARCHQSTWWKASGGGGAVRDVLLGLAPKDVDIAVYNLSHVSLEKVDNIDGLKIRGASFIDEAIELFLRK